MARTQVQSELLATNSISGTIIADNAITATHIATNAISGTLIQDSGIVTTMIAANNITATKVVTNAIQTRHIADDQVTEDKLANAINTSIAAKLPLAGGTMTGNIVMGDDTSIGIADDAERIEFDGAGDISLLGANVGIGTDSPSNLLHISSSTGDSIEMKITNTNADSIGANIHLEKDSASPADNDFCGEITWVGSNDNNQQPSFGSISVQMTDVSDGTEDGDMIFKTSGAGTFAERMRILSDGKVGIGTASPSAPLHVKSAGTGNVLYVESSDGHHLGGFYQESDTRAAFNVRGATGSVEVNLDPGGNSWFTGGNVGIGITAPTVDLHIKRADGTALVLESSNDQNNTGDRIAMEFRTDGAQGIAKIIGGKEGNYQGQTLRNGYLAFHTMNQNSYAEKMRIESTGDIRFGIANAALTAAEVHTFYNVSRGNNLGLYTQGADQHFSIDMWNHTGGSCNQVQFRGGGSGAVTGTITSTGNNATQYNTSSDYRLKENVDYTWDATSRLKQLKPVRFNWIDDDTNTLEDGFLAHEVSSVVPNAVRGEKDAVYTEEEASDDLHINAGDVKRQQLDHSKLVPLLVKTIQELEARIATLEG